MSRPTMALIYMLVCVVVVVLRGAELLTLGVEAGARWSHAPPIDQL